MTGIERLREVVRELGRFSFCYDLYETLCAIADQIEAEQEERITRRLEDREAAEWVRERGGIEELRRMFQDADSRRVELCAALGVDTDTGWSDAMAEMVKRLMPEGMEWLVEAWPRFEDHAPLKLGDTALIDGEADMVEAVQLWIHGKPVIYGDGGSQQLDKGERVKRPAPKALDADGVEIRVGDRVWSTQLDEPHEWIVIDPHEDRDDSQTVLVSIGDRTGHARPENLTHQRPSKVLDADGVEIHVGDTVYHVKDGSEMTVYGIEGEWLVVSVGSRARHDTVTHRAPVLAADGRPLREEEHVYHVETGTELVVKKLPKPGEYQAVVVFALPTSPASHLTSFDPDRLTHERPVLDAGGVPIREGDTVYNKVTGEPGTAIVVDNDGQQFATVKSHDRGNWCDPLCFTHTKPEPPDSWERIEEDAGCTATKYNERRGTIFTTKQQVARDLVRRCRALAERERGE